MVPGQQQPPPSPHAPPAPPAPRPRASPWHLAGFTFTTAEPMYTDDIRETLQHATFMPHRKSHGERDSMLRYQTNLRFIFEAVEHFGEFWGRRDFWAQGTSSLVAPSSDEEVAALRRRCARAIWALVPRAVGRIYFGSLWASAFPTAAAAATAAPFSVSSPTSQIGTVPGLVEGNARVLVSSNASSPPATRDGSGPAPPGSSYASGADEPAQARLTQSGSVRHQGNAAAPTAAPLSRQHERGRNPNVTAAATNDTSDTEATVRGEGMASAGQQPLDDRDEHRILSEIETGILDVFSDGYCNKHLMYSILELVLVRLMPELAERGVIDLWEERLS